MPLGSRLQSQPKQERHLSWLRGRRALETSHMPSNQSCLRREQAANNPDTEAPLPHLSTKEGLFKCQGTGCWCGLRTALPPQWPMMRI